MCTAGAMSRYNYIYVLSREDAWGRGSCWIQGVYESPEEARAALGNTDDCIEDYQLERFILNDRLYGNFQQTSLGRCHCKRHPASVSQGRLG